MGTTVHLSLHRRLMTIIWINNNWSFAIKRRFWGIMILRCMLWKDVIPRLLMVRMCLSPWCVDEIVPWMVHPSAISLVTGPMDIQMILRSRSGLCHCWNGTSCMLLPTFAEDPRKEDIGMKMVNY